uniref:Sperm-tail PG-rich repeat-containing protein 2 n=1 Tax=Fabrea salina TaxID=342563 RepID=A0A7S3I9R6_9CILI|mmetsp:Transcript_1336/g.2118  ORF Transcript_1336/g.2118 Transcript_1336/m.2118 type:complete len:312 (+) Transcript_1336:11-946(+)
MSDVNSASPVRNQTSDPIPMNEIYQLVRGKPEFGMEGYQVPKRGQLFIDKEHKFGRAKKKDLFGGDPKKEKGPSPTSYAPDMQQVSKRYWSNHVSKFPNSKRITILDEASKRSLSVPGPGNYFKSEKGKSESPTKCPMGHFSKEEGLSFLTTIDYHGEESPGAGQYFKSDTDREKTFSQIEKKSPGFKYIKNNKEKSPKTTELGPGYYKNLDKSYNLISDKKSSPRHTFKKSNSPSSFAMAADATKHVPGVGNYTLAQKPFESYLIGKKSRTAVISKYQFKRFSEDFSSQKKWVPGPGSYEILRPVRNTKK